MRCSPHTPPASVSSALEPTHWYWGWLSKNATCRWSLQGAAQSSWSILAKNAPRPFSKHWFMAQPRPRFSSPRRQRILESSRPREAMARLQGSREPSS